MFKTGITSLRRLLRDPDTDKHISAGLLLEVEDDPGHADLRQRIVRRIVLPNTTGKTTWPGRFREIDREIAPLLRSRFPEALSCLDIGVSDGVTALELYERLADVEKLSYRMTDLDEALHVRRRGPLVEAVDDDGSLIQATLGPFVVPVTTAAHVHPLQLVNRLLQLLFLRMLRPRTRRAWLRSRERGDGGFRRIPLLAPEARAARERDPRLRFERLDVFAPPPLRCDFVRMLNVLNLREGPFGFSESAARAGLRAVAGLVAEGGLLLVGRTVRTPEAGDTTHATLFEKRGGKLAVLRRFGEGSELEPLVRESAGV